MSVEALNALLGRELGRTPQGDPIFEWWNSSDLFWPASATGRKVKRTVMVPLIGSAELVAGEEVVPEYRREPQLREPGIWVVAKWLPVEDLVFGGTGGHGRVRVADPREDAVRRAWDSQFPGAEFPAHGWRIPTNARLPRGPHDLRTPNLPDTEWFISCIKAQTAASETALLSEAAKNSERQDEQEREQIGAEMRNDWPAFLNPHPGKRGASWSFPDPHNPDPGNVLQRTDGV